MVAALGLGSSAERRGGSSPPVGIATGIGACSSVKRDQVAQLVEQQPPQGLAKDPR